MVRAEMARRSLREFVGQAWPTVHFNREFISNWHIDAICEHLEAVSSGEIRRLIINVPPRSTKSFTVGVFWQAWEWIDRPGRQFLNASYALTLSIRDSVRCRRVMQSPWYQAAWGDRFRLVSDQNQKMRFENDRSGYRLATSVDGALTGEGGDIIVVDDPHNVRDAESETTREATLEWWDQSMSTRLNDPKTGAYVVIMQRVHESDLAGHILAKEAGWDHLMVPMEYEKKHPHPLRSGIGYRDPREKEGDLLWPHRMGAAEVDALKVQLGSYGTAGQLQQRPAPAEGGIIKKPWFRRYATPPASFRRIVISADTATKEKEQNDPSVFEVFGQTAQGHFLLEVWRARAEFPDLERALKSLCEKWNPGAVLIEDKSSGTPLIQRMRLERWPIIGINPQADKVSRLKGVSPMIEAGLLFLPESAPWLPEFEAEMITFPNATHDDQTDAASQYLGWTADPDAPFFEAHVAEAFEEGRVGALPHRKDVRVSTAWHLGEDDEVAVWLFQVVNKDIHIIDAFAGRGEGMEFYAAELQERAGGFRGIIWNKHHAGKSAAAKTVQTPRSRQEQLRSLGVRLRIVPDLRPADRLNAARAVLARSWFDEGRCAEGLGTLRNFKDGMSAKWTVPFAEAFMNLATVAKDEIVAEPPRFAHTLDELIAEHEVVNLGYIGNRI